MGGNEILVLVLGVVFSIAQGQVEASGNIGNRQYSIWYSTHFLVEKKGLCQLIYFKPKHFGRYKLYEVFSFFSPFLWLPCIGMAGVFRYLDLIDTFTMGVVALFIPCLINLIGMLAITVINDIGFRKERKKRFYLETGAGKEPFYQSKNTCFTVYHLWDSYRVRLKEAKDDAQKINQVNLDYIEYFKNIEHLVVIKENKNGSLQLKIQK